MTEPWFDPNLWSWLPGTALGVLCGLWGSLAGILVPRGKGKTVLWGGYWLFLVFGAVLLSVGLVALVVGQPYGVWYGLCLPGVLLLIVVAPLGLILRRGYRATDERRMRAQELD